MRLPESSRHHCRAGTCMRRNKNVSTILGPTDETNKLMPWKIQREMNKRETKLTKCEATGGRRRRCAGRTAACCSWRPCVMERNGKEMYFVGLVHMHELGPRSRPSARWRQMCTLTASRVWSSWRRCCWTGRQFGCYSSRDASVSASGSDDPTESTGSRWRPNTCRGENEDGTFTRRPIQNSFHMITPTNKFKINFLKQFWIFKWTILWTNRQKRQ